MLPLTTATCSMRMRIRMTRTFRAGGVRAIAA
jgi:hypothetical protein